MNFGGIVPGFVVGTLGGEVGIVYVSLKKVISVTTTLGTKHLTHESLGEIQCPSCGLGFLYVDSVEDLW